LPPSASEVDPAPLPDPGLGGAAFRRALLAGAGAAALGLGVVLATGALPAGMTPFVAGGTVLAVGAGALALVVHGRWIDRPAQRGTPGDGRLLAGRLQTLLGLSFVVKLALFAAGAFTLVGLGVGFPQIAAFAIAFAAASLLCQGTAALCLERALSRRARGATASRSVLPES